MFEGYLLQSLNKSNFIYLFDIENITARQQYTDILCDIVNTVYLKNYYLIIPVSLLVIFVIGYYLDTTSMYMKQF